MKRPFEMALRMNRAPQVFRKAVTLAAGAVDLWLDDFDGAGSLAEHAPNIGGPYALQAGSAGTLSDAVLDGAGGLLMSSSAGGTADIYVDSAMDAAAGTFSIEYKVTVTALSGGAYAAYFDVWTDDSDTGNSMVEAYLSYNITTYLWTLEVWVSPITGPGYYAAIDATALVTLNTEHTILMEVAPGGCQFSFDGSVVASTTVIPDVPHDRVTLVAFSPGMGTTGSMNRARVFAA